jgi:hypothetical protein
MCQQLIRGRLEIFGGSLRKFNNPEAIKQDAGEARGENPSNGRSNWCEMSKNGSKRTYARGRILKTYRLPAFTADYGSSIVHEEVDPTFVNAPASRLKKSCRGVKSNFLSFE